MAFARQIKRLFKKAWRKYGKPTATVVRPVEYWSLPTGFAYRQEYDQILDDSGNWLSNPEDYWDIESVYIVPNTLSNDLQVLIAIGEVPAGTVEFGILSADVAMVSEAHALKIDGDWYDVAGIIHPPGTEWAIVRATRRS